MADREQHSLFDRLEDATADQSVADEARVLDDEQLEAGGMRPIRSWVRTRASSNALRQRRKRQRDEQGGVKQVNVTARAEDHETFRALAEASRQDGDLVQALRTLLEQLDPDSVRDLDPADRQILKVAHSPSLRGRLIRFLGGL